NHNIFTLTASQKEHTIPCILSNHHCQDSCVSCLDKRAHWTALLITLRKRDAFYAEGDLTIGAHQRNISLK
ncbi:hypothetical protein OA77_30635, partial [Pseudomonas coronafaciens]